MYCQHDSTKWMIFIALKFIKLKKTISNCITNKLRSSFTAMYSETSNVDSKRLCKYKVNLLTAWSRVLLEKLTDFAANQKIPRILWNPKVRYCTHKCPPPVSILSQLHPVPTTPSHFLKIHLNIILPSTSWSPQLVNK